MPYSAQYKDSQENARLDNTKQRTGKDRQRPSNTGKKVRDKF